MDLKDLEWNGRVWNRIFRPFHLCCSISYILTPQMNRVPKLFAAVWVFLLKSNSNQRTFSRAKKGRRAWNSNQRKPQRYGAIVYRYASDKKTIANIIRTNARRRWGGIICVRVQIMAGSGIYVCYRFPDWFFCIICKFPMFSEILCYAFPGTGHSHTTHFWAAIFTLRIGNSVVDCHPKNYMST